MATNIPPPLKGADITRFAIRAAQIEKIKPAAAYWCYFYVLEKTLNQGLHNTDEQCQKYVMSLMDKVEQMKTEHADNDAIIDEVAAKAYMEQFGTETFLRADNAVRANKASKTTADTFQAAYTFLDVLHIWDPVDTEIIDKIKYAKYHAVRIAKAIKAGEDPNESNPPTETNEASAPPLDATDPEVQAIAGIKPNPDTVKPLPDGASAADMPQFVDQPPVSPQEAPISLPPYPNEDSSRATQEMPHHASGEDYYQKHSQPDVSPLPSSDGGGYFPHVPTDNDVASPVLPGPPSNAPGTTASPMPPGPGPTAHFGSQANVTSPSSQAPPGFRAAHSPAFAPPGVRAPPAQPHAPSSIPPPSSYAPVSAEVDDEAMVKAQKHARFAISALNFEDVSTAVNELRSALAQLGQR